MTSSKLGFMVPWRSARQEAPDRFAAVPLTAIVRPKEGPRRATAVFVVQEQEGKPRGRGLRKVKLGTPGHMIARRGRVRLGERVITYGGYHSS